MARSEVGAAPAGAEVAREDVVMDASVCVSVESGAFRMLSRM